MNTFTPPDLKAYWYKFLTGLLSLLTMRKFWLKVAADVAAYAQYQQGTLTAGEFLAIFLTGIGGLIAAITAEDVAAKLKFK